MGKTSANYSRRQFLRVGATGVAASVAAAAGPPRLALAQSALQGPPPAYCAEGAPQASSRGEACRDFAQVGYPQEGLLIRSIRPA